MIADCNIPCADPTIVIEQYEPFIQNIAKRYIPVLNRSGAVGMEDLIQVGRIAIVNAQKNYDPEKSSFMSFLFNYVRSAMRKTLGFNSLTGEAPLQLVYLDAPISDEADSTLGETISDPSAPAIDEPMIDEETKSEISEQVRQALERMKSDKQREVITRVYLNGQDRTAAAHEMEIRTSALYALDKAGRNTLNRDKKLRQYALNEIPFFIVGIRNFNSTWTSATEKAVIWRDRFVFHNDDE